MTEWPRYSENEQLPILAECAPTADRDHVISMLEVAWSNYLIGKKEDYSPETRDRLRNIQDLLRQLGDEMEKVHGRIDELPKVQPFGSDDQRSFESRALAFRKASAKYEAELARQIFVVSGIITLRSGNRDPVREVLYSQVLTTWTHDAGRKLVASPSGSNTGGPQARFFKAALVPILGQDVPKKLDDIFKREHDRRKGLREQIWLSPYSPDRPELDL